MLLNLTALLLLFFSRYFIVLINVLLISDNKLLRIYESIIKTKKHRFVNSFFYSLSEIKPSVQSQAYHQFDPYYLSSLKILVVIFAVVLPCLTDEFRLIIL